MTLPGYESVARRLIESRRIIRLLADQHHWHESKCRMGGKPQPDFCLVCRARQFLAKHYASEPISTQDQNHEEINP